jgi:CcmD family protein
MPSDNMPYLFAAYAVTWVAFFLYVFFMSRRQREMEREIEELRRELEEKTCGR